MVQLLRVKILFTFYINKVSFLKEKVFYDRLVNSHFLEKRYSFEEINILLSTYYLM